MIDELKQYLTAKPFKPFRVVLDDGSNLDVTRLFQLGIGRTRFTYIVEPSGQAIDFRLDQITLLQLIENVAIA